MEDKQKQCQTTEALRELEEGKENIAAFFRERLTRMPAFHEKYYKDDGKPSLRTVQRVIYERAIDNFSIWDNAADFFFKEKAKEKALAKKIKKARKL